MKSSSLIILIISALIIFSEQTFSQLSWTLQYTGTSEQLSSIYLINENTGFVTGASGGIYKTINGGINWVFQFSGTNYPLTSIQFTGNDTGYISAGSGAYLKTTTSGAGWMIYPTGVAAGGGSKLFFINSLTGWITPTNYINGIPHLNIIRTTSGGLSWDTQLTADSSVCYDIFFSNSNTGYFCVTKAYPPAAISYLYKTTNGGINWNLLLNSNRLISSIYFVNLQTGYIACAYNSGGQMIWQTTDGGFDWTQQYSGTPNIYSLTFADANTGFGVGSNGNILNTTNAGALWYQQQNLVTGNYLFSVKFVNALTGYAAGANGTIIKTTNGGITFSGPPGNQLPTAYKLYQNFPNPFNPNTVIRFQVPAYKFVNLSVYDILGRKVAALVNENLKPGEYETEWKASDVPSGIYFYRLIVGDFADTKKMCLIK